MPLAERGAYITLLAIQWTSGSVPCDDIGALGRILGVSKANAKALWQSLGDKFQRGDDGLWRNERLEHERLKQEEFRRRQSDKGKASASTRRQPDVNRTTTEPQPSLNQDRLNSGDNPTSTLLSSSSSSKNKDAPKAREGRFPEWYAAYPKKVGRGAALAAWNKLRPSDATIAKMLEALTWQRNQPRWTKDGGEYIPNPSTYLNHTRWEDEPFFAEPQPTRSGVPSPDETSRMLAEREAMAGK